MPLTNSRFTSDLATATIDLWLRSNYENMFLRHNQVAMYLRARNQVVKGHGLYMNEPVMVPVPSTSQPSVVRVTSGYDAVTHTPTTGFAIANYRMSEYILPVSIEQYELESQGPRTEKIVWLESVMKRNLELLFAEQELDMWRQAENTDTDGNARNRMGSILTYFNAGSVTNNGAPSAAVPPLDAQVGVRGIVGASGANVLATVAGLNRNQTNGGAYWATPIILTSQNLSVQVLSGVLSLTKRGTRRADLIFCHPDVFDRLQGLATFHASSGGQMFGQSDTAKIGFRSLRFQDVEILTDDRVPRSGFLTGTTTSLGYQLFAIDTDYLTLRVRSEKPEVRKTDDQRPLWTWTIRWLGQLTSGNLGRAHCRHANLHLN